MYKDARCDQKILDELFGVFGWQRRHETVNGQLCCVVKVKDPATGEWIEKEDVGVESNTEAVKGSFSDSFKRACFNIGIGRELYTSPKIFITLKNGEWSENAGKVKISAKCVFTVKDIGYDSERNIDRLVIIDNSGAVRYQMGQAQTKVQGVQPKTDEFAETMNAFIRPALAQAQTEEEVKRVWDDYVSYQAVPEFVSAVTNRLGEIRNAA